VTLPPGLSLRNFEDPRSAAGGRKEQFDFVRFVFRQTGVVDPQRAGFLPTLGGGVGPGFFPRVVGLPGLRADQTSFPMLRWPPYPGRAKWSILRGDDRIPPVACLGPVHNKNRRTLFLTGADILSRQPAITRSRWNSSSPATPASTRGMPLSPSLGGGAFSPISRLFVRPKPEALSDPHLPSIPIPPRGCRFPAPESDPAPAVSTLLFTPPATRVTMRTGKGRWPQGRRRV